MAPTSVVREFVGLNSPTADRTGAGGHPCQGLYHRREGSAPRIAVIATHIGVGVRWLRDNKGVRTVVLLGNSGGGSLMAAYQSQAKDPNVTPLEGMRPAAGVDRLPAAAVTAWAQAELARVRAAGYSDRPFTVMRTWADPRMVDPTPDADRIFNGPSSTDKSRLDIDADHYFTTPGTRDEQADAIADWIRARW